VSHSQYFHLLNKGILLEEATRVPLVMSLPGKIQQGVVVKEPVSHMDIFGTILDYLQAPRLNKSDGRSLRRFISRKSYNNQYDERVVVSELEKVGKRKAGNDDNVPNFAVVSGKWKLILPKSASHSTVDMLYNLRADPHEKRNLLGFRGSKASPIAVGKAEHLKILLMEWFRRNDGPKKVYTNSRYNINAKGSALVEVKKRRTWRKVDWWQSHSKLSFGRPVKMKNGEYKRNEVRISSFKGGTMIIET